MLELFGGSAQADKHAFVDGAQAIDLGIAAAGVLLVRGRQLRVKLLLLHLQFFPLLVQDRLTQFRDITEAPHSNYLCASADQERHGSL